MSGYTRKSRSLQRMLPDDAVVGIVDELKPPVDDWYARALPSDILLTPYLIEQSMQNLHSSHPCSLGSCSCRAVLSAEHRPSLPRKALRKGREWLVPSTVPPAQAAAARCNQCAGAGADLVRQAPGHQDNQRRQAQGSRQRAEAQGVRTAHVLPAIYLHRIGARDCLTAASIDVHCRSAKACRKAAKCSALQGGYGAGGK